MILDDDEDVIADIIEIEMAALLGTLEADSKHPPGFGSAPVFDLVAPVDEVVLLLQQQAGGRDSGGGQDVGPLNTLVEKMLALTRRDISPLEVGW